MDTKEIYRRFKETKQEAVRLDMALKGFFQDPEKAQEYAVYLKRRIRPAVELLIRREDGEKIRALEEQGWFGVTQLEGFIRSAREQQKTGMLLMLLHLKQEKYGFPERDFSL